jgi:flagellar L-ring protein precursor FlgH
MLEKARVLIICVFLFGATPALAISLLEQGGINQKSLLNTPRGFIDAYKARNVGDVITIKVVENIEAVKNSETNLNTQTKNNANIKLTTATRKTSTLTPDTNDIKNNVSNYQLPIEYSRNKVNGISVNDTAVFTTLISALIVEVDPENGNMVVEGSRQVLMEGETKSLYIRGVVFPKDIDSNNEIPSYKLANAQIQIIGTGSLSKDRDQGLIQKILRSVF